MAGWNGVKGELPGPKGIELMKLRQKYVPAGIYNITPLFAEKASGAVVTDVDGNQFIDFVGGIGVLNVGHCPPEIVEAVKEQAERFLHTCFHVMMYESYVRVAEKLCAVTPGNFSKKAMLANSGAEAVENGVKIARRFTRRQAVIALENSFHGRTLLTMTLTSKANPYKIGFGPFAPEVYRAPSPYCYRCPIGDPSSCSLECVKAMERLIKVEVSPDHVAAVLVEPVQGEGGFIVCPDRYIRAVKALCDNYGILYIDDEVQSGWCRTGKFFAMEYSGVAPDILITAKSMAAGLPLSAVVGKSEVMDSVHVGGIGGTFAGNPLSCAVALKAIEIMEREDLSTKAQSLGKVVMERFLEMKEKYALIGDVRGRGAMCAIEFVKDKKTKEPAADEVARIAEECYKRGLIVMKAGELNNVIRFLPPLVISDELLHQGLDIFEEAVRTISGL